MREIKFRAKRVMNGNWVFGSLLCISDTTYINGYSENGKLMQQVEVIPETVGQFTGLLDKTGKEIYEGDILRTEHCATGAIQFDVDSLAYVYNTKEPYWTHPIYGMGGKIEVIGNIHEK